MHLVNYSSVGAILYLLKKSKYSRKKKLSHQSIALLYNIKLEIDFCDRYNEGGKC